MTKLDTKLITQAAYARHRGCSREAVRQAVADGRIRTFGDKKLIDQVLADHEWARNTRARAGSKPEAEPPLPPDQAATYADWRCRREAADAQVAELHLKELAGELGRPRIWKEAWRKQVIEVREAVMSLAPRAAPRLVGLTESAIFAALREESILILEHISGVKAGEA